MEIDQEEMYRKLGAYFGLWTTVRVAKYEALQGELTDHERFHALGAMDTIDAMLDDLYAVFPYPEPEPEVYQNWETV